jgi:pantetheine hydrolase
MFHEPAVRLIEQYNITTVAFPAAWIDALPLFTAIQFHAAFAAGMGVNLLAANIHRPSRGFIGSGIYTPLGILNFYYDNMHQQGRLLINDIEVLENRRPSMNLDKYQTSSILHGTSNTDEFTSYLFHDLYNFLPLTNQSGSLKVCQKEVCCHLDYVKAESNDLLAFGAFDGLHTYQGRFYLQVCALVKCASLARNSCGSETNSSSSYFQSFSISGSFSGPYIFPDVLLVDQEQLSFPTIGQYTYVNQVLTGSRFAHPLLSAALVSRVSATMFDM